jgi:hypothetical protein
VLNDKNTWKDVDTFCPERHLDINGKIVKTDHFYPFGLGNIDSLVLALLLHKPNFAFQASECVPVKH